VAYLDRDPISLYALVSVGRNYYSAPKSYVVWWRRENITDSVSNAQPKMWNQNGMYWGGWAQNFEYFKCFEFHQPKYFKVHWVLVCRSVKKKTEFRAFAKKNPDLQLIKTGNIFNINEISGMCKYIYSFLTVFLNTFCHIFFTIFFLFSFFHNFSIYFW